MTQPSLTVNAQSSLSEWLNYMGNIHVSAIDMGLERVLPVFEKLGIDKGKAFVFTVAGTNGKGSTTATIAQICQQAGYKTALYQSPHLVSFNERVRIDGQQVSDEILIDAFVRVEQARIACSLSLSFFEMTTLAALLIFMEHQCDVWVLEIGLGGRLDVVNVISPDLCVITNVAIDHTDWLGDTREAIGYEKAGILRQGVPLVYGESDMPTSVQAKIDELSVACYRYGQDFAYQEHDDQWYYSSKALSLKLPKPVLSLTNVATAITAVLASPLAVTTKHLAQALPVIKLAGRFDKRVLQGRTWLFDVAHNQAGANFLLSQLMPLWQSYHKQHPSANLYVVFSMLADKDVAGVLSLLAQSKLDISSWHIATLDNPRAMSSLELMGKLTEILPKVVCVDSQTIDKAIVQVLQTSQEGDFVLVFGSFHTVSESLIALGEYQGFNPKAN